MFVPLDLFDLRNADVFLGIKASFSEKSTMETKTLLHEENTTARSRSWRHTCYRPRTIAEAFGCREQRLVTLATRRAWNLLRYVTPFFLSPNVPRQATREKRIATGTILLSRPRPASFQWIPPLHFDRQWKMNFLYRGKEIWIVSLWNLYILRYHPSRY